LQVTDVRNSSIVNQDINVLLGCDFPKCRGYAWRLSDVAEIRTGAAAIPRNFNRDSFDAFFIDIQ